MASCKLPKAVLKTIDTEVKDRTQMIYFGPVSEAAKGGHSSPSFDLLVGFAVLLLTWIPRSRQNARKTSIWIAIGISAICAAFIASGLRAILR